MKPLVQDNLGFLVHELTLPEVDNICENCFINYAVKEQLMTHVMEKHRIYVMLATDYYRAPWRFGWSEQTGDYIYPFVNCTPTYTEVYKV